MAKVVFIQRVVYAYFGLMSISAVLKKGGHTAELVMESDAAKAAAEALRLVPDVVGFSALAGTGEFEWALRAAQIIKKANPGIITVFGSMHPTIFPDETLAEPCVDALCRCEGEYAMLELCGHIDRRTDYSGTGGLWVRTPAGIRKNPVSPFISELDELPPFDRSMYEKYGYFDNVRAMDVLVGRGCPFECNYCYNHIVKEIYPEKKGFARKHSVAYVIAELKAVKEKYRPRSFTFVDELFPTDKQWLAEFAAKYKAEIGLPFICNIRADTVDEESAALLADAGVFRVCFGVETGNEALRRDLLNKPITNARMLEAAELLHGRGIKFLTANMLGLPGETVDKAFETVELNYRMKTDYLYYSVFQPYPKLKLSAEAGKMGLAPKLASKDYNSTYFASSLLVQPGIRSLENLHKLFHPAVRLYGLKNLFKVLIKLPANFVFDLVFIASFGWMQYRCFGRAPGQLLAMGLGNLKVFYAKPQKARE